MAAVSDVARVLIDSPLPQLDHLFDYSIPEHLLESAIPGVRVRVPLRSAGRVASGIIVEKAAGEIFSGALSELDDVISTVPVLTSGVWHLARRLADRSAGSANDILRLAIPPRMVRAEKAWLARAERNDSADAEADPVVPNGYGDTVLVEAVARGERIALRPNPMLVSLPNGRWVGSWAVALASLAASCWSSKQTAIIAVPDHRDRDQLAAALEAIVPARAVVRMDTGQTNPQRYQNFLRALSGPCIAIGNRSVVYAPAKELGLIAVWDDADPLHSEPLAPYVHTRDAALVRQELTGCALVLSGLVRSLETQRLVEMGWLRDYAPERIRTPRVVLSASQSSEDSGARNARIPSQVWQFAQRALAGDAEGDAGPILVQVARPGYAPILVCTSCHQPAHCTRCSGPLVQRQAGVLAVCRWCGAPAASWQCSTCQGRAFRMSVPGSTRTAEELGRAFPRTRVIVSDGEHPVSVVGPEPALIVATRGAEPIAEGGYRAVILLDGERMMARQSLNVVTDCLRWWMNAAVLATPGAPTFLVGVEGVAARAFATGNLIDVVAHELKDRRALSFPPAVRIVSVTGVESAVSAVLAEIPAETVIDVLGPTPMSEEQVRALVRFDYAQGAEVAMFARRAIVRNATQKRSSTVPGRRRLSAPRLRVCFDDHEAL